MHPIIDEHLSAADERHQERTNALLGAQAILDRFDIIAALDDALQFVVWEDTYFDLATRESVPAGRYSITIRQPLNRKERLRPVLLANIHSWTKQHSVDNGTITDTAPLLVETWTFAFNDHPHGRAADSIRIQFVSPAQEGHELSPTCKLEKVIRNIEAKTESYLTVACKKADS